MRFLTGGEVEMPAYILDNSQNALSEMPQSQAALTRSIANQVGGCVRLLIGLSYLSFLCVLFFWLSFFFFDDRSIVVVSGSILVARDAFGLWRWSGWINTVGGQASIGPL